MNSIIKGKVLNALLKTDNICWNVSTEAYQIYTITHKEEPLISTSEKDILSFVIKSKIDTIIHDKKYNKLFVYKSFFSKSPIYYYHKNNLFLWSNSLSEIKNEVKESLEIDKKGLNLFFSLTYIPPPFTIYKDVFKLPNNCLLTFDLETQSLSIDELNSLDMSIDMNIGFEESKRKTYEKVMHSVESVSKDNFGAFLSGGIDSAIISYCYSKLSKKPIETFSLGFDNKRYDETAAAQIVSSLIKSKHHSVILNKNETLDKIDEILGAFEEPFADSSLIPSYVIANEAKKYVPGVLTGDGGDEVFGGYNKYHIGKLNNIYTSIIPKKLHNLITNKGLLINKSDVRGMSFKINKALSSFSYDNDSFYNVISLGFKQNEIASLFTDKHKIEESLFAYYKNSVPKPSNIHDFRQIDYMISLQGDMIPKVFYSTKAVNLEYQSPFMNEELWFLANSLPDKYLIKRSNKKRVLKEAFKDYFPKNYFNLPKKGFGVPVGDWLRNELRLELENYLSKSYIEAQNIFDYSYISEIIINHISGKIDNTFKVWTFYCFQKWYNENFK